MVLLLPQQVTLDKREMKGIGSLYQYKYELGMCWIRGIIFYGLASVTMVVGEEDGAAYLSFGSQCLP